jgi:hypothetical protein
MNMTLLRRALIPAGYVFARINALPMSWETRDRWIGFVQWGVNGLLRRVPVFMRYQQEQNVRFGTGKQGSVTLESVLLLEQLLADAESLGMPIDMIRDAYLRARGDVSDYGSFVLRLADELHGRDEAKRVLGRLTWRGRY